MDDDYAVMLEFEIKDSFPLCILIMVFKCAPGTHLVPILGKEYNSHQV